MSHDHKIEPSSAAGAYEAPKLERVGSLVNLLGKTGIAFEPGGTKRPEPASARGSSQKSYAPPAPVNPMEPPSR